MLKISISIGFAIALTIIAPVGAETSPTKLRSSQASYTISPRQLISLARQGQFKAQAIPSHNNFRHQVRMGKITAQILVEGAIASKRLPANVREDRHYLQTVSKHLQSGGCGS